MSRLKLQVLAPLPRGSGDAGEIRITSRKGLALLAYLAMHRGERVSRATLAGLLWSDRAEPQARQSLRQTLLTLRRDLGPTLAGKLAIDEATVSLDVATGDVDALDFVAAAESADPVKRLHCLDIAWGSFLAGFSSGAEAFDEWAVAERQRLDVIGTRIFSELASRLDAAGDGNKAIVAVERLIAVDPADEESHRRLLKLEHRYRGAETALARARSLAGLLKRELDAEPEKATRDLVETIRSGSGIGGVGAQLAKPPAASVVHQPKTADAAPGVPPHQPARRRWTLRPLGLIAASAFLALGAATYVLWLQSTEPLITGVRTDVIETPAIDAASWQSPRGVPRSVADLSGRGLIAIAVRPFDAHATAGEPAEVVAAAMSDELTSALSRMPAFRVISRATMDTYRDRRIDAAALGAELGVRYLVEGSVSARDPLLRINVALVDGKTRLTLWSKRLEWSKAEHHSIQDEIVASLGRELQIEVERKESVDTSTSPDVHVLVLKGWTSISDVYKTGKPALQHAEALFMKALEQEPDNARAKVGLAAVHTHMAVQLLAPDPEPHLSKAEAILQSLIERYPNKSDAYGVLGLARVARGAPKKAAEAFEKAIELNPSHAPAYAQLGRLRARLGRPAEGLELIQYAMRLSPRDPALPYWHAFSGAAKLELGRFEEAIADTQLALSLMPWQPRTGLLLVGALAMAGKESEARRVLAELQEREPHLTDAALIDTYGRAQASHLVVSQGLLRVLRPTQAPPQ